MQSFASRAGRWPLAITLAVLGACADEPTVPTFSAPLRPNANLGDAPGTASAQVKLYRARK